MKKIQIRHLNKTLQATVSVKEKYIRTVIDAEEEEAIDTNHMGFLDE